ncbi:MAG: leucyl aminopeptidase [Acidiphilium sp. 37-64-53]|uniref:leucyl aminopeptidase family protein n=1 Tax=Acidiphilium TaxID=522 RepID=UPI000BDC4AA3|nr:MULTISPECIES: leucyl aminopeptidase family protein [Acidiphilium]OYW04037.1 MAG: leucyl aminopeptidase [Acidiphilium sp. 37-64-53]OZB29038.1 MAG: leucyl aminopeptidase [Acidiphilium sp. 34-64-41]HQT83267.1 leucyl aminopeptidase family protein [Acidiphilium rubrum]
MNASAISVETISSEPAALPVYPLRPSELQDFLKTCDEPIAAFITAQDFAGQEGRIVLIPGQNGIAGALLGLGDDQTYFVFGILSDALPSNMRWVLAAGSYDAEQAVLAIERGAYRYDRFKPHTHTPARITVPRVSSRPDVLAKAIFDARDLINAPANLLGPAELADAGADLASRFSAKIERIAGDALNYGYPALAAVGAGSSRRPQMLRFQWGDNKNLPLISLCGKGVCFDSGGYDIKPSTAMLRMKKDMGGAAIALGVAQAVMALNLPVRLDVRIGCVENSISGQAMRPLDVLKTRAGLMVEVGNTDAEGRLVLADLLTDAATAKPDWLIDFATLTGAARVALGPDIPALFSNNDHLANALLAGGNAAQDPLWRLPMWSGYDSWLDSKIADCNTVGSKPMAGAVVAALFLNRFVPSNVSWAHIDTYAWNDQSRPGRPEGGETQSLLATVSAIERFGNMGRH